VRSAKGTFVVRFVAKEGGIAGPVFGVRLVKGWP
jgi:hypothetical protein